MGLRGLLVSWRIDGLGLPEAIRWWRASSGHKLPSTALLGQPLCPLSQGMTLRIPSAIKGQAHEGKRQPTSPDAADIRSLQDGGCSPIAGPSAPALPFLPTQLKSSCKGAGLTQRLLGVTLPVCLHFLQPCFPSYF